MKYSYKNLDIIKEELNEKDFILKCKINERDFIRKRKANPQDLILYVLNFLYHLF